MDEVSDTPGDLQQSKTRSSQGSPNKKLLLKSEDRGLWLKSEDVKYQKPDLSKSDLPKTHTPRKDIEEVEPPVQEERPSDAFNTEEISGSVSSFSDTRTIVANDSSLDEIVLDISSEDVGSIHGKPGNKPVILQFIARVSKIPVFYRFRGNYQSQDGRKIRRRCRSSSFILRQEPSV